MMGVDDIVAPALDLAPKGEKKRNLVGEIGRTVGNAYARFHGLIFQCAVLGKYAIEGPVEGSASPTAVKEYSEQPSLDRTAM
ncbi:MAG: hypothetical protein ACLQU2_24350 [Candidatus Binataceae bacterium]